MTFKTQEKKKDSSMTILRVEQSLIDKLIN